MARRQKKEDSKSEHKLLCLYFVLFILQTLPVSENLTDGVVGELVSHGCQPRTFFLWHSPNKFDITKFFIRKLNLIKPPAYSHISYLLIKNDYIILQGKTDLTNQFHQNNSACTATFLFPPPNGPLSREAHA